MILFYGRVFLGLFSPASSAHKTWAAAMPSIQILGAHMSNSDLRCDPQIFRCLEYSEFMAKGTVGVNVLLVGGVFRNTRYYVCVSLLVYHAIERYVYFAWKENSVKMTDVYFQRIFFLTAGNFLLPCSCLTRGFGGTKAGTVGLLWPDFRHHFFRDLSFPHYSPSTVI